MSKFLHGDKVLFGEPLSDGQKHDVFVQMHRILQKAIEAAPVYGEGGSAMTYILIKELDEWRNS